MSGPYDNYGYPQDSVPPGAAPPPPPQYNVPPPPPPQWGSYREAEYATLAMVLGIIGLASIVVMCGVGLVVSPFAWYYGNKALQQIEMSGRTLGGSDNARAGQIMGIIGTVLLCLAVLLFLFFIAVAASA